MKSRERLGEVGEPAFKLAQLLVSGSMAPPSPAHLDRHVLNEARQSVGREWRRLSYSEENNPNLPVLVMADLLGDKEKPPRLVPLQSSSVPLASSRSWVLDGAAVLWDIDTHDPQPASPDSLQQKAPFSDSGRLLRWKASTRVS